VLLIVPDVRAFKKWSSNVVLESEAMRPMDCDAVPSPSSPAVAHGNAASHALQLIARSVRSTGDW
jgi:hypothetical protein